jgi:hypothetical protein
MFSVPAWYNNDPGRWDRERSEMRSFPQFSWGERFFPYNYRYWRGTLQPLDEESSLGEIAYCLKYQKPLIVHPTGLLVPSDPDIESLDLEFLSQVAFTRFEIEIVYLDPPAVPRIYSIHPRLDVRKYPDHPHLNKGRRHPLWGLERLLPDSDLCVFATQDGTWNWGQHSVADIVEYTSMWLASHLLWLASRRKTWLIPGASHNPYWLLWNTPWKADCACGSGKTFESCCKDGLIDMLQTTQEKTFVPRDHL